MKPLILLLLSTPFLTSLNAAEPTPAPVHCQVPCGIYGDKLRIDLLMEDCATIEKGMNQIMEIESKGGAPANQLIRWVMNKDQHAAAIQEQVASYWLAQRVKAPKDGDAGAGRTKYQSQLENMHAITVAAMKCKQTTDVGHVNTLRAKALAFSKSYFGEQDLKHINEHHGDHR